MRPTILFFGGGSGSESINDCLLARLACLCNKYNIIHLCGKGNKKDCEIRGFIQLEFADDMGLIYAACDYAVARCGSNSANELISLRIPTLFIPLENSSSRGDQAENAEYFEKRGLCRVLREKDLAPETLLQALAALEKDNALPKRLAQCRLQDGNAAILAALLAAGAD